MILNTFTTDRMKHANRLVTSLGILLLCILIVVLFAGANGSLRQRVESLEKEVTRLQKEKQNQNPKLTDLLNAIKISKSKKDGHGHKYYVIELKSTSRGYSKLKVSRLDAKKTVGAHGYMAAPRFDIVKE